MGHVSRWITNYEYLYALLLLNR